MGGAVRDAILNKKSSDQDFLLIGADAELLLKVGFIPVGKDFPVFLHPVSKNEVALARTEKKTGIGYKGFKFDSSKTVSLKDDLKRRDLTVNALALDENGELFDFFSGLSDLKHKIFRHIGPEFSEDPLRLIRLARFLSTHSEFTVHPDTFELCKKIVSNDEIKTLSKERIWQEFSKGLMGEKPIKMINFLEITHAWEIITKAKNLTEINKNRLIYSTKAKLSQFWKAALIFLDCDISKIHCLIPKEVISYKNILVNANILKSTLIKNEKSEKNLPLLILDFMESSDFFRKPDRISSLLKIMFYQDEDDMDSVIENYFKIFSTIFSTVVQTSVADVAKRASRENKSIKNEIRIYRIKIIHEVLNTT